MVGVTKKKEVSQMTKYYLKMDNIMKKYVRGGTE